MVKDVRTQVNPRTTVLLVCDDERFVDGGIMKSEDRLFSLAGSRALVTGASRGIGRSIALGYARAGADVALLARSKRGLEEVAAEARAFGQAVAVISCDVTDEQSLARAVPRVIEELGGLDVVVNNAGGPIFNAPFLDIRPDGFRRVVELNLMSIVHVCQLVGRRLVEQGGGSVVNIDSIGATHPAPLVAPYCAAKAAVVNLTQTLAQEWAPAGVRVNCLSPGLIDTDINRQLVDHPQAGPTMARTVPLGRWGNPDDMVGAAVWLASDASSYVTGALIPVNGGIGIVAPQARPDSSLG
jgi:NAD(P)-dependent dehydrogenase (short-subunit alcohol dehydrogenase family)